MGSNLEHEDLLIKLRAILNERSIKLWDPPYILNGQENQQELQKLAAEYSNILKIDSNVILAAIKELQNHAIERIKADNKYKESGQATLRIRVSLPKQSVKVFNIQTLLSITGGDLLKSISKELPVPETRIKLIFNGKVIKPAPSLEDQGLKNRSLVLALVMTENPDEVQREDGQYIEMAKTRDDALLLTENVDDFGEGELMQLEDQSGNPVNLPANERRALMVGLALQERGRTALRAEDYSLALVLLLEADRHYCDCNSSVLKSVDNWALLQLDIAWCYLCLQSLASANDAGARLRRAEEYLRQSYGPNLERLIMLKGTAANERTLIMRLYLLQAIVAYHQNKRAESRALLEKAEAELNALRVDEGSVAHLVELGWSAEEARRGLRASGGDVQRAHHYLDELRAARTLARKNAKLDREIRAAGNCVDGSPVSVQLVDMLVGMGFPRRRSILALRLSNNHVADAVRIIQEQPELLKDDNESISSSSLSSESSEFMIEEEFLAQLESMGYDRQMAKLALRNAANKLEDAIDILVANGGILPEGLLDAVRDGASASTSQGAGVGAGADQPKHPKIRTKEQIAQRKRRKEYRAAFDRLSTAINNQDDDHLDSSLAQEEFYLAQYKSLL